MNGIFAVEKSVSAMEDNGVEGEYQNGTVSEGVGVLFEPPLGRKGRYFLRNSDLSASPRPAPRWPRCWGERPWRRVAFSEKIGSHSILSRFLLLHFQSSANEGDNGGNTAKVTPSASRFQHAGKFVKSKIRGLDA